MFFWHGSVAGALASAVVGTVAAAQTPRTAARDTLAPAVITATRVAVSTVAPTATTTVLLGADLRARGITRLVDALRLVPGATVVSGGSVGSLTSLFLRGGNSNYVRVLVDGVPVNDAGGFIDLANLTLDGIDRVEVVRGPASVLYGSDAVTGVIQLFTADGSRSDGVRAALGSGSHDARNANVSFAAGPARARFSIAGSHAGTDGILPFNNQYFNDALIAAARFAPDGASDIRLSTRWSAATFHYPTDYTGAVVDHNSEQSDHRLVVSADGGRRLSDRVELRATLTSSEYLPRSNDGPDNAADTVGFYGYYSRTTRTRRAADARINVRAGAATVTIGAEASRDRERSSSLSLSQYGPSADGFEASRNNTGVYAQAIGNLAGRASYVIGLRRDDNSAFGAFNTGRASVGYVVGRGISVRGAIGTAFKAPSFYENFATGYVAGNPALRPEESRSAELGLGISLGDGAWTVAATGYMQRFTNIVQYTGTAPARGAPNYYNVAAADADGIELETRWRPSTATSISATYAFVGSHATATGFDSSAGAAYVKGERLIRRPAHTFTASFTQALGGVTLWIGGTRVGERVDRDYATYPVASVMLPAYVKVDAAAVFPLRARGVSVQVRADNLLDAQYDDIVRYHAPGATLLVGLRYETP